MQKLNKSKKPDLGQERLSLISQIMPTKETSEPEVIREVKSMGVGSQYVFTPANSKHKFSIGVGSHLAFEEQKSKHSVGVGSKFALTPAPSNRGSEVSFNQQLSQSKSKLVRKASEITSKKRDFSSFV